MVGSDKDCSMSGDTLQFTATTANAISAMIIVHASYAVVKLCVLALCITVCCKRTDCQAYRLSSVQTVKRTDC